MSWSSVLCPDARTNFRLCIACEEQAAADAGMLHKTSGRQGFHPAHAASDVKHDSWDEDKQLERVPLEVLLPSGAKLSLRCSCDTTLEKLLEAVQSLNQV